MPKKISVLEAEVKELGQKRDNTYQNTDPEDESERVHIRQSESIKEANNSYKIVKAKGKKAATIEFNPKNKELPEK